MSDITSYKEQTPKNFDTEKNNCRKIHLVQSKIYKLESDLEMNLNRSFLCIRKVFLLWKGKGRVVLVGTIFEQYTVLINKAQSKMMSWSLLILCTFCDGNLKLNWIVLLF